MASRPAARLTVHRRALPRPDWTADLARPRILLRQRLFRRRRRRLRRVHLATAALPSVPAVLAAEPHAARRAARAARTAALAARTAVFAAKPAVHPRLPSGLQLSWWRIAAPQKPKDGQCGAVETLKPVKCVEAAV